MAQESLTLRLLSKLRPLPREAGIALAARSALRVFPIIGQPSATVGTGTLTPADAAILQTRFRALSVAWAGSVGFPGTPAAVAFSRPIGTLATKAATSAAQRSAAQAVLAVANTEERSFDAVVQAIGEAFSAESEAAEDARAAWALDRDIEFLSGNDLSSLAAVPLWLNHPPTWAVQKWQDLKATLHNAAQSWQVWTIWYDDRLDGRIRSFEREMAYVNVSGALWRRNPATVNAAIIRRIEEHEPPPQPIAPSDPPIDTGGARGPRLSNEADVQRWLAGKPREWAVVVAARAGLRCIPALASESRTVAGTVAAAESIFILPLFRAVAAAWIAAVIPRWTDDSRLRDSICAADSATFVLDTPPTNAVIGVQTAISAATTRTEGARGADFAVSASADVAVAMARDAAAKVDVWRAVESDARALEDGRPLRDVACDPLWPRGFPEWAFASFNRLTHELLLSNSDWEVWTRWYDLRLKGRPINEALEIARVSIAGDFWKQGARAANAEIARLIRSYEQQTVNEQVDLAGKLSTSEYDTEIINDATFIFLFHRNDPDFVNALKQRVDKAEFTAIVGTIAAENSLIVYLDPAVVPAAELAYQVAKSIEEEIAGQESRGAPDDPLPPPSPAARFTYSNGQFDIAPTSAWRDREAQASLYHARARDLATGLAERLSRTDAVPDVAGSVAALVDVLGTSVADVQPDLLRLASRSIAAKARVYGHPAAQWEISAESVSAFFELVDVLVDLQTFVKTDLEAHEQAVRDLDLTPEKAAEAKIALDLVTEAILSAPEVISERAQTAFEAAAEVSETATDRDVKVAVEGDRTLLTANLALAVARELGRDEQASNAAPEVSADEQHAAELPAQEGKPETRQKRPRRAKAEADERSLKDFTDRIVARIYQKGPDRIGDAVVDSLTSMIQHAPKTLAGLAAVLALWGLGFPIATGALTTTLGWIGYELRRKNKQSK